MQEYFEKILHREVKITEFTDTEKLPLSVSATFHIQIVSLDNFKFFLAEPTCHYSYPKLKQIRKQLEFRMKMHCVLCVDDITYYARDDMIKENIPFIWKEKQVFIPFAGLLLNYKDERKIKSIFKLSFLTQKFLILSVYNGWKGITVSKAAELLEVSKMSASRCFDEIMAMELPFIDAGQRSRVFNSYDDKKKMWECIRPCMRNPIVDEIGFRNDFSDKLKFGGITALANNSMLCEDERITYVIDKKHFGNLNLESMERTTGGEAPQVILQISGYLIEFGDGNCIDPLSLEISLEKEISNDPRVSKCTKQMLKELVWLKD